MNTADEAQLNDALVMVHLRNDFYRGKFRFALALYVLTLIANIVLISIIVYLMRYPTEPLYFPADKVSRLIRDIPLQEPNMSMQEVMSWTVEAIEAAYSYDFVRYHSQLQDAQKYFTDYGWSSYMKALSASNNFRALTERKFVIVAKVIEPPRLLTQGILSGAQAWRFQMPVLVTYLMPPFSEKSKFANPLIVSVIVQRQNILQSYKGLGIVQLIANIATEPAQNQNSQ